MDKRYWDDAAGKFEDAIFNVLANDAGGRIREAVAEASSPKTVATDVGCGVGRCLPLLAGAFGRVRAIDISAKCLARARVACAAHRNITYRQVDLGKHGARLPPADFCLCINTLLHPDHTARQAMWDATAQHLRPGGRWVIVVPSLESACLSDARLIDWNVRDGLSPARAACEGYFDRQPRSGPGFAHGVAAIDGVPTKHYLKEELQVLLESRGFAVETCAKLEYPWSTEFTRPPRWMRAPYPWDWFVVGRRQKS